MSLAPIALQHLPLDGYNRSLAETLHPARWMNPDPAPRYNLVVVGAGTAGLVTAAGGAIDVIHPYPTQAEAIRRAGYAYIRTRLTPLVAGLMKRWFSFSR